MATREQIQTALEEMPPGAEVTVQLKDGTEMTATVNEDHQLRLSRKPGADADGSGGAGDSLVDADQIDNFFVECVSDGPE